LKSAKERVRRYHIAGTKEVERACVKSNRFHQEPDESFDFDDLNDPRPGGRASPLEKKERGEVGVRVVSELEISQSVGEEK
jgi:hypothetical protein